MVRVIIIIVILTTLFYNYKGNTYYHIDNLKWPLKSVGVKRRLQAEFKMQTE